MITSQMFEKDVSLSRGVNHHLCQFYNGYIGTIKVLSSLFKAMAETSVGMQACDNVMIGLHG